MTSSAETSDVRILGGKCLCGAVQYEVEDRFRYSLNCHCSNCKPFAGIERGKLKLTGGANCLLIYGEEFAHDAHCGRCGSLLYSLVRDAQFVHVTLGTLLDSPSIRPSAHIFVGSKAPWYTITDDLPQHEEFP